jgi:fatty-acyl-CoA synthase
VDNLAKGLISIGVKKGSNVGIWATNVPDWLTFLYATAKIGAVLVTVNTNYKQNELEYLCKDSDMEVLCITDGTWDCNYVDMTYTMLPELKTCERGHLNSERFPYLKNVVYIGMEKYRGMYNTAELLLLGQNIEDETLNEMKKNVSCYDVCNMQYTSGTTGFPKGVMLTHYGISNDGYFTGENMGFTQDDKLCVCVPLFHCFGVVLATMNCLTHGCTEVMVEKFDPLVVLASIHKERSIRCAHDVYRRTKPPDVRYVRPELSAHWYHGWQSVPNRTDETGEREDVYDHHQRVWTHRVVAWYDSDLSERHVRAAMHYGRP